MGHMLDLHRGVRSSAEDCSWCSLPVVGWARFWIVLLADLRKSTIEKVYGPFKKICADVWFVMTQ
jgi:hypothetical protein